MDFVDAMRVLRRRWRILLVGALATLAAGAAGIFVVPTNYQATGQLVLLLPSEASGSATPTNPFLNLEPGLSLAATLIASTITTPETQRAVKDAGFTSKYTVALNPNTGPVLEISVEDTDPQMAVNTRNEIISRLQAELQRVQNEESVPRRQYIHARPNSVPATADPLPGSKIRALAAAGALGIVITLFVVFLADRRPAQPKKKRVVTVPNWGDDYAGLADDAELNSNYLRLEASEPDLDSADLALPLEPAEPEPSLDSAMAGLTAASSATDSAERELAMAVPSLDVVKEGLSGVQPNDDFSTTTSTDGELKLDSPEPRLDSAERAADSAEGAADSAAGTADSAEGAADSAAGTADSAEGTADSAEGTADSAEGTADSAEPTPDSAERAPDSVERAPDSAEPTSDSAEQAPDSVEKRYDGHGDQHGPDVIETAEGKLTVPSHN